MFTSDKQTYDVDFIPIRVCFLKHQEAAEVLDHKNWGEFGFSLKIILHVPDANFDFGKLLFFLPLLYLPGTFYRLHSK